MTAWNSPEILLAVSASDAELDSSVRSGRPVVIDADDVVDWGLWQDGAGIVEGGWTNRLLDAE